jgi:hypothetical protein
MLQAERAAAPIAPTVSNPESHPKKFGQVPVQPPDFLGQRQRNEDRKCSGRDRQDEARCPVEQVIEPRHIAEPDV